MSKICNKNIECDSLRATIKVLSLTPELAKENARAISGMTHQLKAKSNIVSSVCPLCKRVFHPGDALCGCHAATTKSVRVRGADGRQVKGEKRRKDVKCPERVIQPMLNRHSIRGQTKRLLRDHKLNKLILRRAQNLANVKVAKFNPEAPGAVEVSS